MKRLLSIRGVAAGHPCRVFLFVFVASLLIGVGTVSAQTTQQKLDAISARMKQLQDLSARLPASVKDRLSTGAQNLLRTAERWDQLKAGVSQSAATLNATLKAQPSASAILPRGEVSDPSTDLNFSRFLFFTQNETSTAWCGNNVVVAYNDSGSMRETHGFSFNGYSVSQDGGRSFTDQGYLPPGPYPSSVGGDPVAACTDESTFYQSSLFITVDVNNGNTIFGVSVSKSTDGGATFADPIPAVLKDSTFHFIDKPWMAVDPSNPNNIYITYTDVDSSFSICAVIRLGIELVKSTDGGNTWSLPTVVDLGCTISNGDTGSNVAVDGAGNVYVAWEQFSDHHEIDIAKSSNGGASFAPKVTVAIVTPVGGGFSGLLQGGFRNNEFPSLAVDRRPAGGALYVAWNDGGATVIPDDEFFTYNFGDILVSRSGTGGLSWSTPVKVNDDSGAVLSPGADHYQPGIAVDREGLLGVCFYDRRRDPENFLIDRECATSSDKGQTWRNERVTEESFAPSIADDFSTAGPTYMGDYDTVASDALGRIDGFLGAYGDNSRGNPDVKISDRFGDD